MMMRGIRLINWKIIYPDNTVFICKTIFLQKERITGIEKKTPVRGKTSVINKTKNQLLL